MMPDHVAGRVAWRLIFTGVAGEISVPEFGGIFGKEFIAYLFSLPGHAMRSRTSPAIAINAASATPSSFLRENNSARAGQR